MCHHTHICACMQKRSRWWPIWGWLVSIVIVCAVLPVAVKRYFGIFQGSLDGATMNTAASPSSGLVMLGQAPWRWTAARMSASDFSAVIPTRLQRPVRTVAALLGFVFVTVLAWQGYLLCLATTRQISPSMGVPMSVGYLAIPVGASIMALQCILFACMPELMRRWSPSDPEAVGAAD